MTVRGEAGQPYVLTHFELLDRYPIRGTGNYWIGAIPSADLRDAIDQTGLLLDDVSRTPLRKAAIEIDLGKPWAGRGNLDGELSLFFQVGSAGKYVIDPAGVDAFEWTAAKNTMRTTAKVKIKKSRPHRKLRYGRKPTLCISNSASHTSLKKWHALTNDILNFVNIDKIALG